MSLNTEEFMQTTTEDVLDDHLEPCPAGEWLALLEDFEVLDFEFKSGERKGETGYRLAIKWDVQEEEVKKICDREKVTVRQSLLLDITEDGQGLDMGKGRNIGLGQLRTAFGQNAPGQTWSPMMLKGQVGKIKVKSGIYEDRVTADVTAVTAA